MNILLIGGTHFIGPHVANACVRQGHAVTLFHRNPYSGDLISPKARHIFGNRKNEADLKEAIRSAAPDVIVDLFAMGEEDVAILDAALPGPAKVAFLSSADVYEAYSVLNGLGDAPIQEVPLGENASLRQSLYPLRGLLDTPFAQNYDKILVERRAQASRNILPVILRLGMIYGENDGNHRFREFVRVMHEGRAVLPLPSDYLRWVSSMGYVKNIAYGIYLAAINGVPGSVYNLAEAQPVSMKEWAQRLAAQMHWDGEVVPQDAGTPGLNLQQHFVLDTTKIRRELGYEEPYSLEEGLRATIAWELEGLRQTGVTEVAAALIWEGDHFLICQRPADKARGLLWEFVGGKVEPGETKEEALIRECREELAVTLTVGEVFMEVTHRYPDVTVHLTLFHAAIAQGTPRLLEHNDMKWITPEEIPEYAFCPADEEILKRLREIP